MFTKYFEYSKGKEEISITWSFEDVLNRANSIDININKKEACIILAVIDDKYDCTLGITWDTIDTYLYEFEEWRG
ncbi:MAG: hypothetical protein DRN27_05305 [Thermoplasmata archaeon]|nr:MAG: hypothetical protein DRN27_05305 [Thermoplasmata archaeon]